MSSKIGVLGCGWLGMPLAKSFLTDGHPVFGSTTSKEKIVILENEGITSFFVRLEEDSIKGHITELLQRIDVLIINVPPKLRGDNKENYIAKMQLLHKAIKKTVLKKVIFVSSTSIYGAVEGEITEKTVPLPNTESGRQLLAAEAIFTKDPQLKTSVVRFGGLIGPDRHPIERLAGKTDLSNGNSPVNLIHLDDCITILKAIVQHNWWNEVFNAVYPLHPTKRDYYCEIARLRGLPLPEYMLENGKNGKLIHPFNLINVKNLQFHTSIVG